MTALLAAGLLPVVLLTLYAAGHYACALLYLARRRTGALPANAPREAVTVAIAARNEGEGAVRVVRSLLAQDHAGPIEIVLLLKNEQDNALPLLTAAFPPLPSPASRGRLLLSTDRLDRHLRIDLVGADPKHIKINAIAEHLNTPYVALLDGDHEAYPDWIRTSIAMMQHTGVRIIQGRREPIAVHGLFGLWDSLHQHIGCEVANAAYTALGASVFFTGTTAVMNSELLHDHPLRDCLTEDTDLSYTLLLEGERIGYNPHSGSKEEVSPDLYSFLARRRRWAHGHTETFLRHLARAQRSSLSAGQRLQFLFHGTHYLVALVVFWVHTLLGLSLASTLPLSVSTAVLFASGLLAFAVARTQPTRATFSAALSYFVLVCWLLPAVLLLASGALALRLGDLSLLALPEPALYLFALPVALFGLFAPLFVLLSGLLAHKRPRLATASLVVISYPLALYLDIAGVLIGLVDLLAGQRIWLAIARSAPHTTQPVTWLARSRNALVAMRSTAVKPSRWLPVLLAAVVLTLGVLFTVPTRHIDAAMRICTPLEHDGHPWIVSPSKLPSYCSADTHTDGTRTGRFAVIREDPLSSVDTRYWNRLDTTFFCNNAVFSPNNVQPVDGGGLALTLKPEPKDGKDYTSGSIATVSDDYLYGRYEVTLKPPAVEGVLTAFFLYRFDPWQEIDMEFLGKDTTKTLLNVFYNPGEPGDLYNYGYRGTPVLVDLGFDAALDFHTYTIEWDPNEIRWFVDDELIHARPSGRPTPIPHLPMRFHVNTWPICSEELAGKLDTSALPASAHLRSVTLSRWVPPWLWSPDNSAQWRERADWIR